MAINHAARLLKLKDVLRRDVAMDQALAILTGEAEAEAEAETEPLAAKLLAMLVTLPRMAQDQAIRELGPGRYDSYAGHVQRAVDHFRNMSPAASVATWFEVLDVATTLSFRAIADLLEMQTPSAAVDSSSIADLSDSARDFRVSLRSNTDIDDRLRAYLDPIASHLVVVLDHIDIFGREGVAEVTGRFISTFVADFPDLIRDVAPGNAHGDEEPSERTKVTNRLWGIIVKANTVMSVPANIAALAQVAYLALGNGS